MTLRFTYKGFDYPAFVNGSYESNDSLNALVDTNANSVSLSLEYGIDAGNSQIYQDPNFTDSLTALGNTIKEAEADGLSVMVRPLIDFVDAAKSAPHSVGDWRGYYVPSDPATFFASYKTMLVQEATLAQADGAQMLSIGTEIDQLTGPAYLSYWQDIISSVRAVFTGKLTYSAIWDDSLSPWQFGGAPQGTGDITTQVSFWNLLDYVGIDEYAPISDKANPTLQDLTDGWTKTPTDPTTKSVTGNQSLINYFEGVSNTIGKPLLFTELGYESATDAASQPFFSSTNQPDATLQSNLYQAFFNAWSQSGDTSLNGVYFWDWDPKSAEVGPTNEPNFSPQGLPAQTVVTDEFAQILCFCAGTHIATPRGEVPVEALTPGDTVLTAAGAVEPIVWIGTGRVLATREASTVIVRKGALADNVPSRDLHVTKGHSLFIDGALIPVEFLLNHRSIVWDDRAREVEIYHIELARHDVLIADGAPAESYRDDGNRWLFNNANPGWEHLPQPPCAPIRTGGPLVDAVWRRLLDRSALADKPLLTDYPDLHLVVDGCRLDATVRKGEVHVFALPRPSRSVRIVSRAAEPAKLGVARDPRLLGVALRRIILRQGTHFRVIEADDARLTHGFHGFEDCNGYRWTNGNAALPLEVFAEFVGPVELVLQVGCSAQYAATPPQAAVRPTNKVAA